MMKRLILFTWLLTTFISTDIFSQSKEGIRNNFYEAESWILFEAYQDALPLYLQLVKTYPENANFKYRIGQCYLNIPGEKAKSISYLEEAVKNIDPKYKEGKFSESGAPYDALYYLANAYRINNQIDKAITTYEQFRKNLNPQVYDTTVVKLQIQDCLNARELMRMPLYIKSLNLGNTINGINNEFNPVVTDKGDLIIFSRSQPFYDAILYSTKVKGQWSEPKNMNEILKVDRDLFPTSVSSDGNDLYLYSSADYDGIIYTSRFENGTWDPIVKLNDNINTKYWESHATISHDNKKLYFTSNRKGGLGGLDIYVSSRDSTGDWGPAVNMGPVINTPYNEESPFLTKDDKILFFSSRGHFNMGGYDIFYSTLLPDGKWSEPLNVGYPLNTTDDDVFFKPMNNGYEGYTSKEMPGGFGKEDIYSIEIFSNDHPRRFFVRGKAKIADLISSIDDSIKISATNTKSPGQKMIAYSNPLSGQYDLKLSQGDYKITYEGEGAEKVVKNINLPLLNPSDTIEIPFTVLPRTDFIADLEIKADKNISVSSGDTVVVPLNVEPRSQLTVEHWANGSPVSVSHFAINKSAFNYKVAPEIGKNRLVFMLTDRFSNTASSEVIITRKRSIITQPVVHPEYGDIIVQKQIEAFEAAMQSRATGDLLDVINGADVSKKQFSKIDDYVSFLKDEAAKKGLNTDEADKLALEVAVKDNILSQAAVDYLAKFAEGEMKDILSSLDINEANLKSWTDLQQYIESRSAGRLTRDDLDKLAAYALGIVDPFIAELRDKIMVYADNSSSGDLIRKAVSDVDSSNKITREDWLMEFYNDALKHGLTREHLSELLVVLSSMPDTKVDQYRSDLALKSAEPLKSALNAIDLKTGRIKTPESFLSYLFSNKEKYSQKPLFKSIADLISSKNISADIIKSHFTGKAKSNLWILGILLGLGFISLFFIWWRKKKDKKKEQ